MTRFWIGLGLLLGLLAISLGLWLCLEPFHNRMAENLEQAAQLALSGDWSSAQQQLLSVYGQWQSRQNLLAALTDHSPMEQMQTLFREITIMQPEQSLEFADACIRLAQTVRAMGQTHRLTWWGVL